MWLERCEPDERELSRSWSPPPPPPPPPRCCRLWLCLLPLRCLSDPPCCAAATASCSMRCLTCGFEVTVTPVASASGTSLPSTLTLTKLEMLAAWNSSCAKLTDGLLSECSEIRRHGQLFFLPLPANMWTDNRTSVGLCRVPTSPDGPPLTPLLLLLLAPPPPTPPPPPLLTDGGVRSPGASCRWSWVLLPPAAAAAAAATATPVMLVEFDPRCCCCCCINACGETTSGVGELTCVCSALGVWGWLVGECGEDTSGEVWLLLWLRLRSLSLEWLLELVRACRCTSGDEAPEDTEATL